MGCSPAGSRGYLAQQVAYGIDALDRSCVELHADVLAYLQRQVHPAQGIDVEVELRARLRRKPPVRVPVGEQLPDAQRCGIFEQRAVLSRHLLRADSFLILAFHAPFRPFVAVLQDVSSELAESRVLQGFTGYGVL